MPDIVDVEKFTEPNNSITTPRLTQELGLVFCASVVSIPAYAATRCFEPDRAIELAIKTQFTPLSDIPILTPTPEESA